MTTTRRDRPRRGFALAAVTAALLAPPPSDARAGDAGGFDGPLVITKGGTYRGRWRSTDPSTPAVTVRTSEPVVIENSELEGPAQLIRSRAEHARLTVRDCTGRALHPGPEGRCPGRFLEAEGFDAVEVLHNAMEGTAGIYLLDYANPPRGGPAVRVVGNRVRNIDGRKSDGRGGFLDFNDRRPAGGGKAESGYEVVQFLQLDKVRHAPGVEVAWNEVVNEPGKSRVEDNINIYLSSGTPESPILIRDNYIQGAYTVRPWQRDTQGGGWAYDWGYSGGGILLGDGSSKDAAGASAHVRAEGNQVVSTTNYGVAIAAGHDHEIVGNRVVSSGRLPGGRAIANQNVGAYVWDSYKNKQFGTFYNNRGRDNLVGWVGPDGARNDWWRPDAASWVNNANRRGPITLETEAAELAAWRAKVGAAGVTIGPRPQAPPGRR